MVDKLYKKTARIENLPEAKKKGRRKWRKGKKKKFYRLYEQRIYQKLKRKEEGNGEKEKPSATVLLQRRTLKEKNSGAIKINSQPNAYKRETSSGRTTTRHGKKRMRTRRRRRRMRREESHCLPLSH